MEILRIVTLVYAAVLVLALAASLIAILVSLLRIGRALGEVEKALSGVADTTRPLEHYFDELEDATRAADGDLGRAATSMTAADDTLFRLAERLGVIRNREAS